jgi:hypothetical protein
MSGNEPTRQAPHVWEIDHGWAVYSSDGDRIGDVADVLGTYIVVEKGFLFKSDLFVPVGVIGDVQPDRVALILAKDQIAQAGWDRPPAPFGGSSEPTLQLPLSPEPPAASPREAGAADEPDEQLAPPLEEVDVPLRLEEIRVERYPLPDPGGASALPKHVFQELDIVIPVRGEELVVRTQPVVREVVRVERGLRPRDVADAGPADHTHPRPRFSMG